jgi:hypothetical protein
MCPAAHAPLLTRPASRLPGGPQGWAPPSHDPSELPPPPTRAAPAAWGPESVESPPPPPPPPRGQRPGQAAVDTAPPPPAGWLSDPSGAGSAQPSLPLPPPRPQLPLQRPAEPAEADGPPPPPQRPPPADHSAAAAAGPRGAGREAAHADLRQALEIKSARPPLALFGADTAAVRDMREAAAFTDLLLRPAGAPEPAGRPGGGDGVRAHRVMVAAHSTLLRRVLLSPPGGARRDDAAVAAVVAEGGPGGATVVALGGMPGAAIEAFVRFVYEGRLRVHVLPPRAHARAHTHAHTRDNAQSHRHTLTQARTYAHARMHICALTHSRTLTHARTHARTRAHLPLPGSRACIIRPLGRSLVAKALDSHVSYPTLSRNPPYPPITPFFGLKLSQLSALQSILCRPGRPGCPPLTAPCGPMPSRVRASAPRPRARVRERTSSCVCARACAFELNSDECGGALMGGIERRRAVGTVGTVGTVGRDFRQGAAGARRRCGCACSGMDNVMWVGVAGEGYQEDRRGADRG